MSITTRAWTVGIFLALFAAAAAYAKHDQNHDTGRPDHAPGQVGPPDGQLHPHPPRFHRFFRQGFICPLPDCVECCELAYEWRVAEIQAEYWLALRECVTEKSPIADLWQLCALSLAKDLAEAMAEAGQLREVCLFECN